MGMMKKPTHYTTKEGGMWEVWPYGYLNTNDLTTHIKDLVDLTVLPIVAVKFEDGTIFEMPIESIPDVENLIIPGKIRLNEEAPRIFKLSDSTTTHDLGESLIEAHKIINGERQDSYGNPEDSFTLIAEYWSTYLDKLLKQGIKEYFATGSENATLLTALDVAHMMMLFKLARCTGQKSKRDNYIDIQGYAAIAADRLVKE